MRIAFLGPATECDVRGIGGYESTLRRLAIELVRNGHLVEVLLYDSGVSKDLGELFGPVPLRLRYFATFAEASAAASERAYDLVLDCHVVRKGLWSQYLSWKRKVHGEVCLAKLYLGMGGNKVWRHARYAINNYLEDVVFGVSPRLVASLSSESRVEALWLPPPVPDHLFTLERHAENSRTTVAFVGRLDTRKGALDVLSAYEELTRRRANIALIADVYQTSGDGHAAGLATRFRELGARVSCVSDAATDCRASEQRITKLLGEADVVVAPYTSLSGTLDLPLVVLEALAAGCIVLSTPVGDIPALLPRDWLLSDRPSLLAKLERLADAVQRQKARSLVDRTTLRETYAASCVSNRLLGAIHDAARV